MGKRNVLLEYDGEVKQISNTLYVPRITKNLLFVRSINDQRYIVIFESIHFYITSVLDPTKLLAKKTRDPTNRLYKRESNYDKTPIYMLHKDNSIAL
uniref:Uncharacterized protein n=2 Tax=Physcomitrium patens TaxID=3218 RepID=A0A7I3ZZ68_PHYPA